MSGWFDQLRPASYRTVKFTVLGGDSQFGRRNALHEYPKRDEVWVEDLGRGTRKIGLTAYLVGDDAIQQRERLVAAAETEGPGELVHPTLGRLDVSLMDMTIRERWDKGRYFEIGFAFIEAGERVFPSIEASSGGVVAEAAAAGDKATAAVFIKRMNPLTQISAALGTALKPLTLTLAAVEAAASTVVEFTGSVRQFVVDATCLYNSVKALPGRYGRYFRAQALGVRTAIGTVIPAPQLSVAELTAQNARARQKVASACSAFEAAASGITASTLSAVPDAATAVGDSILEAISNPGDAIRILRQLAMFNQTAPDSIAPIGVAIQTATTATSDLARRSALLALARAAVLYQPFSKDDAIVIRDIICDLLDLEVLYAADQGDDDVYSAFRAILAAVANDLTSRGESLASVKTFVFNANLPALVLAHRMYRDYTRVEELISETNTPHPAFMPKTFRALAS